MSTQNNSFPPCSSCGGSGKEYNYNGDGPFPCRYCTPSAPQPVEAKQTSVAWASDDFYSGHQLPILHEDQGTNYEIIIQALCSRLDTARQALAGVAAMQVVQPQLVKLKQNAAWAMDETDPRRLLPRSASFEEGPQPVEAEGRDIEAYLCESGNSAYLIHANDVERLDGYFADGFRIHPLGRIYGVANATTTPQPEQLAIDLEQFRPAVRWALGHAMTDEFKDRCNRLLAIIDGAKGERGPGQRRVGDPGYRVGIDPLPGEGR